MCKGWRVCRNDLKRRTTCGLNTSVTWDEFALPADEARFVGLAKRRKLQIGNGLQLRKCERDGGQAILPVPAKVRDRQDCLSP